MGAATREHRRSDSTVAILLSRIPPPVRVAFAALLVILGIEALHEIFGLGGSHYSNLLDSYFYDIVAAGAGILMISQGLRGDTELGWVFLGLGTFSWVVGDVLSDYSVGIGNGVSVSDGFWLAWYPLAVVGLFILVRERFQQFDFARWIDGIALALVVATPGVALALQPAIDESHVSLLAHIADVAYPAGDILLLGATIGVIALAGWRPGRSWYLLSTGLSIWVIADALYSVQRTNGTYVAGRYDYLWPAGLLVMAFAAWQPRGVHPARELYGWKAVALPVICQLFALGTQVWGLLATLGESERIMTMAVLAVVIVQLYLGRPRRIEGNLAASAPAIVSASATAPLPGESPPYGGDPEGSHGSPAV